MAEVTKIEWATHTFNLWIGCSKVHTGCAHCYAEAMAGRFGVTWGPNGTRNRTSERYWKRPLAWERQAAATRQRPRIFPSLCDPFEHWHLPMLHHLGQRLLVADEEPGRYLPQPTGEQFETLTPTEKQNLRSGVYRHVWMDDLRRDFFALIDRTPHLDWLLLTKRPENIRRMWPVPANGRDQSDLLSAKRENAWLIYSASDQATLEAGLLDLLKCCDLTSVLGLSLEPLLGPINLDGCWAPTGSPSDSCPYVRGVNWVIVGGESGPHARPCNIDWICSVVEQCAGAGVPCFVKQLGSRPMCVRPCQCHGHPTPMCLHVEHPKGGNPAEWPEDLRVRQFPAGGLQP